MALALTAELEVQGQGSGTDPSFSYTTTSFTPEDNCLLCVVIGLIRQSTSELIDSTTTNVSGGSLTWTRRISEDTVNIGDGYCGCVEIWTAPVVTAAAMTVTVTTSGTSGGNRYAIVHAASVTGYNTGDPVGATATGIDVGQSSFSMNLSASPAADSIVLAALQWYGWISTATPASGWTEMYDTTSGDQYNLQSQYRGGSTSAAVAWDDASDQDQYEGFSIAVALEIKAAGGGGGGIAVPVAYHHLRMMKSR
jgi:hypothetical protein